jgi:hypothetical protein
MRPPPLDRPLPHNAVDQTPATSLWQERLLASPFNPGGVAFGLDMTDQMLALAGENKRKSGLTNGGVEDNSHRNAAAAASRRSTEQCRGELSTPRERDLRYFAWLIM